MVLHLTESQRDHIQREAIATYPNECCGIIFGTQRHDRRDVTLLQPASNDFDESERSHRFSISPRDLMEAERLAAQRDELVLGFYHSHPNHPAEPSQFDRAHAWPFYSYVIISVSNRQPREMKCWQFDEQSQQFTTQEISVVHADRKGERT